MIVTVISRHDPARIFQRYLLGSLDTCKICCMRLCIGFARLEFLDSVTQNIFHRFVQELDFAVSVDDTYDIGNLFDNITKPAFTLDELLPGGSCLGDVAADPAVTQEFSVSTNNRLTLGA